MILPMLENNTNMVSLLKSSSESLLNIHFDTATYDLHLQFKVKYKICVLTHLGFEIIKKEIPSYW